MFFDDGKRREKIYQMGFFQDEDDQARVQRLLKEIREFVRKPLNTACDMRSDPDKESTRQVMTEGQDKIKKIAAGTPTATSGDDLDAEKENVSSNRGPGAGA
jgi:hypothetical protein